MSNTEIPTRPPTRPPIRSTTRSTNPGDTPVAAETTSLKDVLMERVAKIEGLPLSTIGFLGIILLLYSAVDMLRELESSFNTICGSRPRRGVARRLITYWAILTLGVLLLLATFQGGQEAGGWVTQRLTEYGNLAWVGPVVERVINVCINIGLLMLAYMTIPAATIRFRSALVGGFVAGLLFELAKGLFTLFLKQGGVERLYGALALLPLSMLWLYVTWVTALLGLQIAYALQHFDTWVARFAPGESRRDQEIVVDPVPSSRLRSCLPGGSPASSP